ncbi:hypothetical protein HQ585_12545 [candidate division KSB1 bacterium]|nr:hypothetical protein [candidate division KSB1 bacterium]
MNINELKKQLEILCTPKWKFWISESKRRVARENIIAQGPKIVIMLMELSAGTQSSTMISEVTSIVKSFGNSAISFLAKAGEKACDLDTISAILYTLLKFSELTKEIIPCLILWMSGLSKPNFPTAGSEEIDKMIRPILNKLPAETIRWFIVNPERNRKETIELMAVNALARVGSKAKHILPVLKLLYVRRRQSHMGYNLNESIQKIEAS